MKITFCKSRNKKNMITCSPEKAPLSKPTPPNVYLTLRLSIADFQMIEAIATQNQLRKSTQARLLLLGALNDLNDEKNPTN